MTEATAESERQAATLVASSVAALSARAAGPDQMVIDRPSAGQVRVIDVVHAKGLKFSFALADAQVAILDVDAVLSFPDGGKLILPTLVLKMISAEPPQLRFANVEVDPQSLIANAGDMRFFEQLPQLAASETAKLENKGDTQQSPNSQSVQLPAAQQFSNTPAPSQRAASASLADPQSADSNKSFGKRVMSESAEALRSEGALVDRSDRAGEAPEPANATPTITSGGGAERLTVSHIENSSAVTQVEATDSDNTQVFFTIAGGVDSENFVINGVTGQLYFLQSPNFENTQANYQPNIYEVVVAASDGNSEDLQTIYVTVTDVNEAPTGVSLNTVVVSENVATGTIVGRALGVDPDIGAQLTYSFAPGGDAGGRFAIDAVTGDVSVLRGDLIDFEASDNQLVVIRVTDQEGFSVDRPIVLTVLDTNDAPIIASNGGGSNATIQIPENATAVTLITATDADAGATLTYSIVGGADAAIFVIDAVSGVLRLVAGADFENPSDQGQNEVFDVVVQVSDQHGGTDQQSLAVTITDVNEAPLITGNTGYIIPEDAPNGTFVSQIHAQDPDAGDTLTYSLAPGGDGGGIFEIDAISGQLSVRDNTDIDYVANPTHTVVVRVTDSGGLTDDQAFTIRITDVNDAPVITSNGGGATATFALFEGASGATVVTATDADGGSSISFSIVGGADAARFQINAVTGALQFISAPDFEAPLDANGDNVYQVTVRASDGVLHDTQALTIQVRDANEAPVLTSDGGNASASLSAAENSLIVTTVTGTDVDAGQTLSYIILGGADAARFTIDAATGQLRFISAPNFEMPGDIGANNVYDVIVGADDGNGGIDSQALSVSITNVNEAPVITSFGGGSTGAIGAAEGVLAIGTITASDQDFGAIVNYTISGGADASLFTINSTTGVLSFVTAPDFEAPSDSDANNVYEVLITASDGGLTDTQAVSVTLSNANEPPVITSTGGGATGSMTVVENTSLLSPVTAVDNDSGSVLAYSITGGADASLFAIDATTGALSFVSAPNFESPSDAGSNNVYDVQVTVTDQFGSADSQSLQIAVTNQNEDPTINSNGGLATASVSIVENGTSITTMTSVDPDAGAVRVFSIVGGADASLFTINATTGALVFNSAPNFEAPGDAGANNVYDVVVQVSDILGGLDTQALAVSVTNQNEAPDITSLGGAATGLVTIGEGGLTVTSVLAIDPDAASTITYSITGGSDASLFAINASTGALTFNTAPDFEMPSDSNGDNIYNVVVHASDGALSDSQIVQVTINNQNEAPVISSGGGGVSASASVIEGATAITTVVASDSDAGATLTYSIIGGADQAAFTLNASTGVLTFILGRDFETPGDAGGNNIYDVIVQVSDGLGGIDSQTIAVSVTNQNEAPVITSNLGGATASISVAENATTVTTVTATDVDAAATRTFSIAGGADAGRFLINATTGALIFSPARNFEAPGDTGGNNVYDVVVRVTDQGGLYDEQAIAVSVTNVNESPTITSNGGGTNATISLNEGLTAVTTVTATDPDAGSVRIFSLLNTAGTDFARFTIHSSTGVLTLNAAPDFETPVDVGSNNSYIVGVRVADGLGGFDDQTITVNISNVNEAPLITSNGGGATAALSVVENTAIVTTVTATDPDAAATRTFSISGGADAALFGINGTTGELIFLAAPNLEAPADAGANNVYDVRIRVTDQGGLADEQDIAVTVTNQNEVPVITSDGGGLTAALVVAENVTTVTTVVASDVDAATTITYSITGGADAALFTINATTGALAFITAPNFEAPADAGANNVYDVQVTASDGALTDSQDIAVTVTNANEFAPVISSNGGGPTAAVSVAENGAAVTTVIASDLDAGATITYSITGGADSALFTVNATTGVLTFNTAPDFEAPADTGANNVYDVQVTASDGSLTDAQDIAVTVTGINDNAPVITSNGGGSTGVDTVFENGSGAFTTVASTDADFGATRTVSIVGGADAALFSINSTSGLLRFTTGRNFEAPSDADLNGVYEVIVQVTDGTFTDTQTLNVTVANVNEAPEITSDGGGLTAALNIAENTTIVTTVTATDVDAAATRTFSITGADAGLFGIDSTTGALTFLAGPNFEAPTDTGANNVYDVRVRVTDQGGLFSEQDLAITVTNQNEAPVITSNGGGPTATLSIAENATAVTTVAASDADASTTLTYTIIGGADAALFVVNSSTGALSFASARDFENPVDADLNNTYDVIVQVSDGVLTDAQSHFVTINNVNEAPVITSNGGASTAATSIAENTTTVTTVTATDVDAAATRTYTISGGADQSLFTINSTTGALAFASAPDFDSPSDVGLNNIYDVRVRVTDQGGLFNEQDIAVTVTNANEAPVISTNGGVASIAVSMAENTASIDTFAASDVDAATTLTWSLSGTDAGLFAINASTGALTWANGLGGNFETAADANLDGVYEVNVVVSDGSLTDPQALQISLMNVNEAPDIVSDGGGPTASLNVLENSVTVLNATTIDPDAGATRTYSITGGLDAALFNIDVSTGLLTFVSSRDFETPTDSDANNSYVVTIRSTDQFGLFDEQTITVNLQNENEAPVITSNGGGPTAVDSIAENSTASITVVASADPDAGATRTVSIIGGADAALFTVHPTTGALRFASGRNFETPSDADLNGIYEVIVQVSDGTLTDTQTLSITVNNVNEAPFITSNGGGATASISIAENGTAVTTVVAGDPDASTTLTYSITGGLDQALFTINATTGALAFTTAPNFEAPADAGANNVYDVQVTASDGALSGTQDIAVTVTNVNDAPVIVSDGGGPTASVTVFENSTVGTDVSATDQDFAATETFTITGGADAARFTINASDGVLTFITAPNFEAPTDADTNNTYEVQVTVSDGTLTDTQSITITVANQNEAPDITSNGGALTAALSVAENTTAVTSVVASDPDASTTLTYSITGGADQALFTINATTGALAFITATDFETPADAGANNIYDVRVTASDGTLSDVQDIAITVTNVSGATINGTVAAETLNGTAEDEIINGNGGNDFYNPGLGADTINGTVGGYDVVDYRTSNAAVTVNLSTGAGLGGHAAGDTYVSIEGVYGSAFDDAITGGVASETFEGGDGADSIDGGTGSDWVLYGTSSVGVTIDLNLATQVGGHAQGDVFTNIENVSGSQFADVLRGSASSNFITGLDGDDTIEGREGDDTIEGGLGADTLSGGLNNDTLYGGDGDDVLDGNNDDDTIAGDAGLDQIFGGGGNDSLSGGDGNDIMDGNSGVDILLGGDGNDTLVGGLGADTLNGGDDADTLSYAGSNAGVSINLFNGVVSGGHATGDTISDVENVTGSSFDDVFFANNDANAFEGGLGVDQVSYISATAGVSIDLINNTGSANFAAGDTYSNVESIVGSTHGDAFTLANGRSALGDAGSDSFSLDSSVLTSGTAVINGGADLDIVSVSGAGTSTIAHLGMFSGVEMINFDAAGIVADLSNFTAAHATGVLGASGPGNTLFLNLDGNDTFSVAAGEHHAQVGSITTFYSEAALTNEIARVIVI